MILAKLQKRIFIIKTCQQYFSRLWILSMTDIISPVFKGLYFYGYISIDSGDFVIDLGTLGGQTT